MSISPNREQTEAVDQRLARIDRSAAGLGISHEARDEARSHALDLYAACGSRPDVMPLVALRYAAQLLSYNAVDLAANPAEATRLIERVQASTGMPRVVLGQEVLRSGRLRELPVKLAIEVQLALLLVFAAADSVSLWTLEPGGEVSELSHVGDLKPGPAREAAALLLQRRAVRASGVTGAPIARLHPPAAALVLTHKDDEMAIGDLLARAAAPDLAVLLDGETLVSADAARHTPTLGPVERRLARLRYDLHDGPQQDVHLLAQDLALFREQLRPIIAGDPNASRLVGRLDDLDAQLVGLDGDLRRLSTSVQSPFLQTGSLVDALGELASSFAARAGVDPQVRVQGPLEHLSDSQQIALLALIREALSNVRKHSDARTVQITIVSDEQGVHAEVIDDGNGFHPDSTLLSAARAGHLGLVGMHERVRMLGGKTQIESRPGGPTVISATLPPWPNVSC